MRQYRYPRPIYSKDLKDIPERLRPHEWVRTIDFNKLPRYQLKVRMCCSKCEEKVKEEIWEVRGVVDVEVFRVERKVVVTGMPEHPEAGFVHEGHDGFLDTYQVLRRARKIDCRAKFVQLDHPAPASKPSPDSGPPKPKPKPQDDRNVDNIRLVMHPGPSLAPFYSLGPPDAIFRDPAWDDNTPFYVLLFVILLLSVLVFRK